MTGLINGESVIVIHKHPTDMRKNNKEMGFNLKKEYDLDSTFASMVLGLETLGSTWDVSSIVASHSSTSSLCHSSTEEDFFYCVSSLVSVSDRLSEVKHSSSPIHSLEWILSILWLGL